MNKPQYPCFPVCAVYPSGWTIENRFTDQMPDPTQGYPVLGSSPWTCTAHHAPLSCWVSDPGDSVRHPVSPHLAAAPQGAGGAGDGGGAEEHHPGKEPLPSGVAVGNVLQLPLQNPSDLTLGQLCSRRRASPFITFTYAGVICQFRQGVAHQLTCPAV